MAFYFDDMLKSFNLFVWLTLLTTEIYGDLCEEVKARA